MILCVCGVDVDVDAVCGAGNDNTPSLLINAISLSAR